MENAWKTINWKNLTVKCYARKHILFYKFDIEHLSLQEVQLRVFELWFETQFATNMPSVAIIFPHLKLRSIFCTLWCNFGYKLYFF